MTPVAAAAVASAAAVAVAGGNVLSPEPIVRGDFRYQ